MIHIATRGEDQQKTKDQLIREIEILQHQLNQYMDFGLHQNMTTSSQMYNDLSEKSLNLIHQSLQEQLQFYSEAEQNPLNIENPPEIPILLFFDIFLNGNFATIIENDKEQIILVNQVACNLFGYSAQEFLLLQPPDLQHVTNESQIVPLYNDKKLNRFTTFETQFKKKNGSIFPGEIRLLKLERQGKKFFVAMITDISTRKKAENDQQRLIEELQDALKNIQTLKGLIPICGICRKIRTDSGYWNNLDIFLQANSDVRFSHELCPDCKKKNRYLIFSYFNQLIGPMAIFHVPEGPLDESLTEIATLMDLPQDNFYEVKKGDATTMNLQFNIPDTKARGGEVLCMISFAVIGGDFNSAIAEKILTEFIEEINKIEKVQVIFTTLDHSSAEYTNKLEEIKALTQRIFESIDEKIRIFHEKK